MRTFSVDEANSLLPMVRGIVASIQRTYFRVQSLQGPARQAAESSPAGGGMIGGMRYVELLMALAEGTGRLEALGVQIKDYGRGLIDFPSFREGRVVLLCWELGESDQLEWWHDMEAGYAGRQPLD